MVLPEGCLKFCCFSSRNIMQDDGPMSLYSSSIEEIWNSSHLRAVRRKMFKGEEVFECAHCYKMEDATFNSHRINSNSRWKSELGPSFDELVTASSHREFAVFDFPVYLQLIPGNLCNLKCRICFPEYSSKIESDNVHSRWVLGKYKPESRLEGTRSKARFMNGLDSFGPVVRGIRRIKRLVLGLNGNVTKNSDPETIKNDAGRDKWRRNDGSARQDYGAHEGDLSYRFAKEPWFKDRLWLFQELLKKPERLRALYLTGGEPMIQMEAEEIVGYLVQEEVAPEVTLELNTNCTVVKDTILNKFYNFKRIYIGLSIDAYGPYYEYIRYPAKWHIIRKNIAKLINLPADKFTVTAVSILHAYNVLNIVNLLRYFDKIGLDYGIEVASEPKFIALGVLPSRVRKLAAGRLRVYANSDCPTVKRTHILSVADVIETIQDNCSRESLHALMLFTNDLDATRGQNFRQVHPELLGMIQEEGFKWVEERCFFGST